MKSKPAKSFIPMDRHETVRKDIIALLREGAQSAKDISADVKISEKEAGFALYDFFYRHFWLAGFGIFFPDANTD